MYMSVCCIPFVFYTYSTIPQQRRLPNKASESIRTHQICLRTMQTNYRATRHSGQRQQNRNNVKHKKPLQAFFVLSIAEALPSAQPPSSTFVDLSLSFCSCLYLFHIFSSLSSSTAHFCFCNKRCKATVLVPDLHWRSICFRSIFPSLSFHKETGSHETNRQSQSKRTGSTCAQCRPITQQHSSLQRQLTGNGVETKKTLASFFCVKSSGTAAQCPISVVQARRSDRVLSR